MFLVIEKNLLKLAQLVKRKLLMCFQKFIKAKKNINKIKN